MADPVRFEDADVVPLLTSMNLDKEGLVECVRYAEGERALCTSNDVPGFAAMMVYDKTARGLRERYCGPFWEKDDSNGQAGIRHVSKKLRIIPCNFDENTGNFLIRPTNNSPKGEVSKKKTFCNATGWLPGLPDIPAQESAEFKTWILGVRAVEGEPLRAELSFPIAFDGKHFTRFAERIILLTGDEDEGSPVGGRRDDPTDIVDIAVVRR